MSLEHTLSRDEAREWLTSRGQTRRAPHALTRKILHWVFCARCGLVMLRNDDTRRAARAPCVWEDDK